MPLIIWVILIFTTFFLGITIFPLALFLMIVIFFTIIPIFYNCYKKTDEYRGEKSYINKEVTFETINSEIYVNNKKMNVTQNKSKTKIYVDDTIIYTGMVKGFKIRTAGSTFIGIIEEPQVKGFIDFCNENNIKIDNR